jgi:hypothetical protein
LSAPPHGRPPSQHYTPRCQLFYSTARSTAQTIIHIVRSTRLPGRTVYRPANNLYRAVNPYTVPRSLDQRY